MTNSSSASIASSRPEEIRYVPLAKIASGGMATVFVGALRGPLGFSQLVAIKRPHEHLLEDESFRQSLVEEARLAARIRHANVVDVRDIEVVGESVQLVMDYVEGASLGQLMAVAGRAGKKLSPGVVVRILLDALAGLSAVHAVTDEQGMWLGLVHRDISPHNILVGIDGVARVTDFGIAMAETAWQPATATGTLKGKLGYMAPEYIKGVRPDQRVDVFAMGIVAWEALAGRRLFKGANEAEAFDRLLHEPAQPLGEVVPELGNAFDDVLARALAKEPEKRFQTAESFANALEEAAKRIGLVGTHAEVGREVQATVGEKLESRRQQVRTASAALDAMPAAARADTDSFEYDATTRKYEPAQHGGISTGSAAANSIATSDSPAHRRRLFLGLSVASIVLTILVVTFVSSSNDHSTAEVAPASSATFVETKTVQTNPAVSAALTEQIVIEPATSTITTPPPIVSTALTSNVVKPASPARTTVSTSKSKQRTLPPNPYGP